MKKDLLKKQIPDDLVATYANTLLQFMAKSDLSKLVTEGEIDPEEEHYYPTRAFEMCKSIAVARDVARNNILEIGMKISVVAKLEPVPGTEYPFKRPSMRQNHLGETI